MSYAKVLCCKFAIILKSFEKYNNMSALTKINLSFPYNWSNPKISDKALILSVFEHTVYQDIVMIIIYYGADSVTKVFNSVSWDNTSIKYKILNRMLNNAIQGLNDDK